jgi:hypothetical protein
MDTIRQNRQIINEKTNLLYVGNRSGNFRLLSSGAAVAMWICGYRQNSYRDFVHWLGQAGARFNSTSVQIQGYSSSLRHQKHTGTNKKMPQVSTKKLQILIGYKQK